MFGRKKPNPGSGEDLPPVDDLPPMPPHLGTGARTFTPVAVSPAPASTVSPPALPSLQGPAMTNTDTPATGFRPEIARRPDLSGIARPSATAAATAAAAAAAPKTDTPDPNTLIVGRQISLTGQIAACDKLIIEGRVEASLSDSRFIEISETGMFKGTAVIEDAEIRGRFEGKLSVRGRLLIRGTGKVTGEISYGQLEIECGGQITGTVEAIGDPKAGLRTAAVGAEALAS